MFKNKVTYLWIILAVLSFAACSKDDDANNDNTPESEMTDDEIYDALYNVVESYSARAHEVCMTTAGRIFTDHNTAHAVLCYQKSYQFLGAIEDAINAGKFTPNVTHDFEYQICDNEKLILAAGMLHDLGMAGDGYYMEAETDADGNKVKDDNGLTVMKKDDDGYIKMFTLDNSKWGTLRTNHSLNGCLHLLRHRPLLEKCGLTDAEIDMAAAAVFAHSKSTCDVRNLTLMSHWTNCFNKIDALVRQYNKDKTDMVLTFDRSNLEKDMNVMGQLASLTLALRVGDVSRDSGPDCVCQSGEIIHIDRSTIDNTADNYDDETKNALVTVSGEKITNLRDVRIHCGEQNVAYNLNYFDSSLGCIVHLVTVYDPNSAPYSTMEAVYDHIGEFMTAVGLDFKIYITYKDTKATDETRTKWEKLQSRVNYTVNIDGL